MKTLLTLAFAGLLVTGAFAGCTAPVDSPEGVDEDTATAEGAIQLFPAARYYTIRKNADCTVRLCTGYFVEEVNAPRSGEHHVDLLKFVNEDLAPLAMGEEGAIPDGGLVLRGLIGPPVGPWKKRTFVIYDAYRGMPGVDANRIDGFYRVSHVEHPARFVAAELNARAYESLVRVDLTRAIKPHVEQAWLQDRVLHHGALVAGHLHEQIGALDVSQVFLKLPDERAECAPLREECSGAAFPTYTRDAERCMVFDVCRAANICRMPAPGYVRGHCTEGYTRVAWRADVNGCIDWACEPDFIEH